MIMWLAGAELGEHIIGDLEEEFRSRTAGTGDQISIIKETALILPGLVRMRLSRIDLQSRKMTFALTMIGFALLVLWSRFVTRPALMEMHEELGLGPDSGYLYVYLLFRLTSILLVGFAISFVTFSQAQSFAANFMRRLAPLLLLIVLPQMWFLAFGAAPASHTAQFARVAADCLVLLIAARVGYWMLSRKARRS